MDRRKFLKGAAAIASLPLLPPIASATERGICSVTGSITTYFDAPLPSLRGMTLDITLSNPGGMGIGDFVRVNDALYEVCGIGFDSRNVEQFARTVLHLKPAKDLDCPDHSFDDDAAPMLSQYETKLPQVPLQLPRVRLLE